MEVATMEPWYIEVDPEAYKEEEIRQQHENIDVMYDQYMYEPFLHYMRRHYCSCSIPSYFKSDYPDDDDDEPFLEELGKLEISMRSRPNYIKIATESLVKDVVVELIWTDSGRLTYMLKPEGWEFDNWGIELPLTKEEMDNIYTSIIQSAASLIYFFYPQAALYKIGHDRTLKKQLDKLWDHLQQYCKEDRLYHEVCIFVIQLISNNDEYNLVTEEDIGDMIFYYPNFERSRFRTLSYPSFPVVAQEDKDELFKDIAAVVKDFKPPPLKADELTHWMMTLLKGDEPDVESNIIRKTINDSLKLPVHSGFHDNFHPLLHELLYSAKHRAKSRLGDAVLPLIEICEPKDHEMSRVIIEVVEVAELRRMALGARFIGRSHLIWAFYKLGYALPPKIRSRINLDVADEDHPPYHIYMAAVTLSLLSWEKCAKLLHFIFAVIYSKDIGIDGRGVIQLYGCFQEFKQDLEEVGDEIEHKHTSTMRPCRAVDAIIQAMKDDSD